MRILIVNSSDNKGGAAQVGWNLLHGLRSRGHQVDLWVGKKSSNSPWVTEIPVEPKISAVALRSRVTHRLGINLDLHSQFPKNIGESVLADYDVVHLHDLPAWNWRHFRWLAAQVPLLWTIHSMAPFTGNCLYSYGCNRYREQCGRCPQHGKWPLLWNHRDGSRLNLGLKRWWSRGINLHLIGVSNWISECCRESRLFGGMDVTTIKNAVNPERFFPVDRQAARARLGVPATARTVLVSVAGNPLDTRKGIDLSIDAMNRLQDFGLFLLPMGIAGDTSELMQAFSRHPSLPPKHVSEDAEMRDYYAAADVVWHPSRADTSSMVSLEAFACGTPVIAAAVGGVPEVVGNDKGLMIPENDGAELASMTRRFFEEVGLRERLQHHLRNHSATVDFETMLTQHEEVYTQVATKASVLVES